MSFPKNFTWGVASASYQIEGAANEDGKGPSVWDMFCRKPGAIWRNQSGDVACDHYHRWQDDVKLMKELGIPAYRFSISWPRVLPQGVGSVNEKGLDFYSRLVDGLLSAGVEPWVTLFHWDYPLALYRRGGWLNRDSAEWFAEYTGVIAKRLSDRVTHWMTHNEPQCFINLGLQDGYHAPGDKLRFDEVLLAIHHTLLGHGRAVQTLRTQAKAKPKIGVAMVPGTHMPATESPADIEAARRAMFRSVAGKAWGLSWWCDPMFLGQYPEDGQKLFGDAMPKIQSGDYATIGQPLDFLGANIYNGQFIKAGSDGQPESLPLPPGYPKTTQDFWHVTPEALYWGPKFMHERYHVPIVITENGHQNADVVSLDGKVHDPQRIDYLHRYLRELRRASEAGVPIQGYFQWCFTDNFEWAMGDAIRVGLVFTDYPTQARILKDSACWYRDVIRTNGAAL
jgi:beta-glucosidase